MRGVGRVGLAVVAVVAAVASVGGCAGKTVAGSPKAMGDINTASVGGLPLTNGPSGPKDGVPDAKLTVEGTTGSTEDRLATNAIADLYDFWKKELPAEFGVQYTELRRLVSYDSNGKGVTICGENTAGVVNAFYCGDNGEDAIAWDRGVLLPQLKKQFGPMSVVGVLAHEMGHAVQTRLGAKANMDANTPTIVREQQADCFMGTFFRYVAEGKSKHFQVSTGKGLNDIMATLFSIRDPAGYDHMTEGAHGLAFDRVYAFQEGFTKDPKRCAQMDTQEINGRVSEQERSDKELHNSNEGDIDPTTSDNLSLLQKSLNDAFKDNNIDQPEIKDNGSSCAKGQSTKPVTYCPDDNVIGIDASALKAIAAKPAESQPGQKPSSGGGLGDFAAFAEIASRYALAVQKSIGAPLDDDQAGLRTACLTGAWAGFTNKPEAKLHLAVGDLDEAVAELLQDDSLVAADVNGKRIESGFARVEAFRRGYLEGAGPCTKDFGG